MLRELEDNPLLNLPRSVMIPATIGILVCLQSGPCYDFYLIFLDLDCRIYRGVHLLQSFPFPLTTSTRPKAMGHQQDSQCL